MYNSIVIITASSNQRKIEQFLAKISQIIPTKLAIFSLIVFRQSKPQKFDIFSASYQKPVVWHDPSDLIV